MPEGDTWYLIQSKYGKAFSGTDTLLSKCQKLIDMLDGQRANLSSLPAMQAELGDLFIESALGDSKNFFLIETQSGHLILRNLHRIREQADGEKENPNSPELTPADVQLIYIEPTQDGTVFYDLPVTEEGDFEKNVPGGFFAERAKELI